MCTAQSLRDYPSLVKAFTGMPADQFWALVQQMTEHFTTYTEQQRQRVERQRAVGAGRTYDLSLATRVALVLTYLRLHIPQATVAALFGASQADVSRDLRRLLPLIQQCLPCPVVWEVYDEPTLPPARERLTLGQLAERRVLLDATEQRVARPSQPDARKAYYSGKQKQFTLKPQFVADGNHTLHAISVAVPGAEHDKALSDRLHTLVHLPTDCEVAADKGYQGLATQVPYVQVRDSISGAPALVPRLMVYTPIKKPTGRELTDAQKTFNQVLSAVRMRVEHCSGWAKNWAILATRFRCDHTIYTSIMRTVCGLVNTQTQRWQTAKANCA